jgi:hypothetical protein
LPFLKPVWSSLIEKWMPIESKWSYLSYMYIYIYFFFLVGGGFFIWVCCGLEWNLDAANTPVFFTALRCWFTRNSNRNIWDLIKLTMTQVINYICLYMYSAGMFFVIVYFIWSCVIQTMTMIVDRYCSLSRPNAKRAN